MEMWTVRPDREIWYLWNSSCRVIWNLRFKTISSKHIHFHYIVYGYIKQESTYNILTYWSLRIFYNLTILTHQNTEGSLTSIYDTKPMDSTLIWSFLTICHHFPTKHHADGDRNTTLPAYHYSTNNSNET